MDDDVIQMGSTQSMKHWKVAGGPKKPRGSVTNWYNSYGVEKAVVFLGTW